MSEPIGNSEQLPVAYRYGFDGYGYLYIDSGSGSDWQTRIKDAEPLYTKQLTNAEPIAWMHTNSKQIFKTEKPNQFDLPLFTPLYTHPMRDDEDEDIFRKEQVEKFYAEARPLREKYKPCELTDEEIKDIMSKFYSYNPRLMMFAQELLKKASEK